MTVLVSEIRAQVVLLEKFFGNKHFNTDQLDMWEKKIQVFANNEECLRKAISDCMENNSYFPTIGAIKKAYSDNMKTMLFEQKKKFNNVLNLQNDIESKNVFFTLLAAVSRGERYNQAVSDRNLSGDWYEPRAVPPEGKLFLQEKGHPNTYTLINKANGEQVDITRLNYSLTEAGQWI